MIQGICDGCQQAHTALVGGETAEMPGLYQSDDYDLAGFCVGIVEEEAIIRGQDVKEGDVLLGIHSSGPHSNGYSLIRHILKTQSHSLDSPFEHSTLGETLLQPTKIYVQSITTLLKKVPVHALAHITGGGIVDNLPRVLPPQCTAVIDTRAWQWPTIFQWLQKQGNIETQEMYRTFNCGIGMLICVDPSHVGEALKSLQQTGETATVIGHITARHRDEAVIFA